MAKKQGLQRIAVAGEFNIFTAGAVREQMLAALGGAREIEVDLAHVTDIDSAGVQLMIAAKREATARKKTLRFAGHSPAVLEALDLTELSACLGDPVLIQSNA